MDSIAEASPRFKARVAGVFYLITFVTGSVALLSSRRLGVYFYVVNGISTASYIVVTLLFYGIFTPLGLCMRLRGQDPMRRTLAPEVDTYRVVRQPRPATHMRHQF